MIHYQRLNQLCPEGENSHRTKAPKRKARNGSPMTERIIAENGPGLARGFVVVVQHVHGPADAAVSVATLSRWCLGAI